MKKLLALMLCLAMAFCMFGCGQEQGTAETDDQSADTYASIPLGGGLGDYPLPGAAYGKEYVKIETPEYMLMDTEIGTTDVYYSTDSCTPYIVVYRWKKNGETLEDITAYCAKEYGTGEYQMATEKDKDGNIIDYGFYTTVYTDAEGLDGECYYVGVLVYEDGDDFIEMDFYGATEEYELGKGLNQYLWIPKGYDAKIQKQTANENNEKFRAVYDESFYFPEILIEPYEGEYEAETKLWSDSFPDGLPFTEEQYEKWEEADWNKAAIDEYYAALGLDIKNQVSETINGCDVHKYSGPFNGRSVTDAYIYVDDEHAFNIWLDTDRNPAPRYGSGLLHTLHSK